MNASHNSEAPPPSSSPDPNQNSKSGSKLKSFVTTTLKILFAGVLIFWLWKKGALDPKTFVALATPSLVLTLAFCVLAQIVVNNQRWLMLLRGQHFDTTIGRTLPLSFIGMFFNFVMPGGVGGDVVKGYYVLQEHPEKKVAAAVSIFMDRLVGFFVMIGTAFAALFFNYDSVMHDPQLRSVAIGVGLLFVAFIVFFVLSFSRILQHPFIHKILFNTLPGGRQIHSVYVSIHSYRRDPGAFLKAIALSCLTQVFMIAFTYFIGIHMDGAEIPLSGYIFLVPIGTVVQALPISPAGIGVGQAAFYFLFNHYLGHTSELGPTSVTAMQLMSFAWGLVGAFFFFRRGSPREMR